MHLPTNEPLVLIKKYILYVYKSFTWKCNLKVLNVCNLIIAIDEAQFN